MAVSAKDLYPVVQDLTDAEYGCCSSDMIFGSFSMQELAVPSATPRSLCSSERTEYQQHERRNSTQIKHRDNSLIQHGEPVEERESAESGVLGGGSCQFEDSFVLTRQVSAESLVFQEFPCLILSPL